MRRRGHCARAPLFAPGRRGGGHARLRDHGRGSMRPAVRSDAARCGPRGRGLGRLVRDGTTVRHAQSMASHPAGSGRHSPKVARRPAEGVVIARFRALFARFVPPGAVLLAILTFASYFAGLFRDRIFARTFGAGPELDAYNAAFVLPELALDVLVASGLTAPFVPVFTTLGRGDDPDAPPRFAQTVLTLAIGVMAAAEPADADRRPPTTIRIVAPGFDAEKQAQLPRPVPADAAHADPVRGLDHASARCWSRNATSSPTPSRRSSTTSGSSPARVLFHERLGIMAAAVGAVIGAVLHLGIRLVGMTRTTVRVRFRLDLRMRALHEFLRAHGAQDGEPSDRAAHVPVLHERGVDPRGRQRLGRQLRAQLPERPGGAHRRRHLAGGLPQPVGCLGGRRPRRVRARSSGAAP